MERGKRETKPKKVQIPLPTDWKRAQKNKNCDQNKTISVPGCCSSLSFSKFHFIIISLFSYFRGRKKRKKNIIFRFFYPSNAGKATGSSFLFHFLNLPPFLSFQPTPQQVKKKKSAAATFFLSPSFAAQLLPPPPPSSRRTDRLTGQTAEAAVAVVVRNQNREGNWQANLNVGPFSFFNVVAKAIRRKEKKEETYGHVENEILYMLMKTEREGGGEEKKRINSFLPAKDSAEEGGVEAFGRREASLDFADRHLVLGCGRQERQAAGHRAEHVRWRNWARQQHIFCFVLLFSFKQPNEK
jgi:hypothetical protein